ncbi:hypothetical protein ACP275_01G081800 [Erythranthe tilingii]
MARITILSCILFALLFVMVGQMVQAEKRCMVGLGDCAGRRSCDDQCCTNCCQQVCVGNFTVALNPRGYCDSVGFGFQRLCYCTYDCA